VPVAIDQKPVTSDQKPATNDRKPAVRDNGPMTRNRKLKKYKQRLDLLLVDKGLAPSRQRARALIMAGKFW